MTSEEKNNISPQPEKLCGVIDSLIRDFNHVVNVHIKYPQAMDNDDRQEAKSIIEDYDHRMEDLRGHIEAIRTWGQEWKDLAKKLLSKEESIV